MGCGGCQRRARSGGDTETKNRLKSGSKVGGTVGLHQKKSPSHKDNGVSGERIPLVPLRFAPTPRLVHLLATSLIQGCSRKATIIFSPSLRALSSSGPPRYVFSTPFPLAVVPTPPLYFCTLPSLLPSCIAPPPPAQPQERTTHANVRRARSMTTCWGCARCFESLSNNISSGIQASVGVGC